MRVTVGDKSVFVNEVFMLCEFCGLYGLCCFRVTVGLFSCIVCDWCFVVLVI